jgi:threonine/homoserine efflux transporter RhtA
MLGEEFHGGRRKSRNEAGLVALLVISKALRSASICQGFFILHNQDLPVLLYTFLTVIGAAVTFLAIQRPWRSRKPIDLTQWLRVIVYSIFLLLNLFFWNMGLKYYGPIR